MKQKYWIGLGDIMSTFFGWLFRYTRTTNQSISGRAFERMLEGDDFLYKLINKAFSRWEEDHCFGSWLSDEERGALDAEVRIYYRKTYPNFDWKRIDK